MMGTTKPGRILSACLVLAMFVAGAGAEMALAQGKVTAPEKFFGFQLGADRKIARWDESSSTTSCSRRRARRSRS